MLCPSCYTYVHLACFVLPDVGNFGLGGTKELRGLQDVNAQADSHALGVVEGTPQKQKWRMQGHLCGRCLCRSSSDSGGCDGLRERGWRQGWELGWRMGTWPKGSTEVSRVKDFQPPTRKQKSLPFISPLSFLFFPGFPLFIFFSLSHCLLFHTFDCLHSTLDDLKYNLLIANEFLNQWHF